MSAPFVIAEFATCHDLWLDRMRRGIAAAKLAGANAFKTWWTSDAERTCARMSAPEMYAVYRMGQFPREWLPEIAAACHAAHLEFLCTVDLPEDIAVVASHVDRFKIASWGWDDAPFIRAHYEHEKPLVISLGASSDEPALIRQVEYATWRFVTWFLHCVSGYPTPLSETNLGAMTRYGLDGFSDHTRDVLTGALAVAAGARILEVHFCLEDTPAEHPDRAVAHEPAALAEYIRLARLAAVALGDGRKRLMPSEEANVRYRYV